MIPYNQNIALQILSKELQKQVDKNEYLNDKVLRLEEELLDLKKEKRKADWSLIGKGVDESFSLLDIDAVLKGRKNIENVENVIIKLILHFYNLIPKENA